MPAGRATDLPAVWLEAKGSFSRNTPGKCGMTLAGAGEQRTSVPAWEGTVRLRGASSLGYPKKSYAVYLDQPASPLGMDAHRHWILNAAFIDRSLMRHKLAYDLFRSLSERGRPRPAASSRFVEVYLDGAYQGVYLLMERVDRELAGLRHNAKDQVDRSAVYKAISHDAGFVNAGHEGFRQVVPDPGILAYWQPLDALMQFIHAVPAGEFFSAQRGIGQRLDLDSAIDFHLLVLVTGNADGITKNFYLARPRSKDGAATKFFFIPWDYDGAFGQNWNATPLPPELWLSNSLFDRLLNNADYRGRFVRRWEQLRERQFSTRSIQEMIDANAKVIRAAAGRNAAKWASSGGLYPNQMTFDQDIALMKTWTAAHIAWLDRHIQKMAANK